MEIFYLTLKQMLMMFTMILVGFVLRKKQIVPDNAHITLARLETFAFVPALSLFNQMTQCTPETFKENASLFLYGLGIVLVAVLIAYPLSRLFIPKRLNSPADNYQRNIFKYALTFGNYGFMGNFIILGVFGEAFFFRYSLFTFPLLAVGYSWGMFVLVPKEQNAGLLQSLKKGLLTPPMISLVLGILLGLMNAKQYMPDFLMNAFGNASKCQGPVAMLLAGVVIGGYNFKELIQNKKVYAVTAFRLILIPAVLVLALYALGTSREIIIMALVAFATPLGLNTIVYPAAYGGDTKTGASMAMISHALSVITLPLMYLLLIVGI